MKTSSLRGLGILAALVIAYFPSCKNSFDLSSPVDTRNAVTVTIRSSGLDPVNVFIRPGGQLTFENQDTVPHQMVSSGACDWINTPTLLAGSSFKFTVPTAFVTCGYQDQTNASLNGIIQTCNQESLFVCR